MMISGNTTICRLQNFQRLRIGRTLKVVPPVLLKSLRTCDPEDKPQLLAFTMSRNGKKVMTARCTRVLLLAHL